MNLRWISLLCCGLSTTWSQSSKTVTMSCVSSEKRTSPVVNSAEKFCRERGKENEILASAAKIIYHQASHANEGKADSCWLLSGGIQRLQGVFFFLPTVARPAETCGHKELCFGSGHCWLLKNRQTEKEGRERCGGQTEGQERTRASSSSRASISDCWVPLFILPSLPAPQQLLRVYFSRERPLWWFRLRDQCVFSEQSRSLSLECPWIHVTSALPLLFLCSCCLLPNDFVSLHPSFFLSFQTSSVHLGLLLSLRSLWASLQVYF